MADIRQRPGPPIKDPKSGQPKLDAAGKIRHAVRWQARVRRNGYSVSQTFPRKAEAEAWAMRIESQILAGTFQAESRRADGVMTLKAALERYVREVTVKKSSWDSEARRAKRLGETWLGKRRLDRITNVELAKYKSEREAAGRGAHDIRLDFALISHLYNVSGDWEDVPHDLANPVSQLKRRPIKPRPRNRRLERGELEKLLAAAVDYGGEIGLIIEFAIETALRRSQIVNLRWEDIDRKSRVVTVLAKDAKRGPYPIGVPISRTALAILKRQARRVAEMKAKREKLQRTPKPSYTGPVWVTVTTPNAVSQAFSRICKKAKIQGLRFHDLRHEATTRLAEKGLTVTDIATVTQHKTLNVLWNYTHQRPSDVAKKLG